jgi:hypothetical protein
MRKKILALLSVLIILGNSMSLVSATEADGKSDTAYFRSETRSRGAGSYGVQFDDPVGVQWSWNPVKWNTNSTYYVTLTKISYRIPGVPYTFTTAVGRNDLIFRPYTSAGVKATDYPINFRYGITDTSGEIRKTQSYAGVSAYAHKAQEYSLKCSLNSTSETSLMSFDGRFTP